MAYQENAAKWIKKDLIPEILKSNNLDEVNLKKTEVTAMESMKNNWASSMFEINLILGREDKIFSLLVKVVNENPKVRKEMNSDRQFFNEIHFYSKIVPSISSKLPTPYLKVDFENLFPKHMFSYYHRTPQTFDDAVLVLENLKPQNFKLGNRTSLDLEHCTLALKHLGSFHASSYFLKEQDEDNFMKEIVKPIQESFFDAESKNVFATLNDGLSVAEQRVIDHLASELPEGESILRRLRDIAARKPFDVFTVAIEPEEPLAVLCHGDFLRNNLLYRYEDGAPVDVKIIDFQAIRYGSPIIDISLFFCMNIPHELRVNHFEELLHVYHKSLTDTLAALLKTTKETLDEKYSFQSFLTDFRQRAVYGYLVGLFFLPWMLVDDDELATIVKLHFENKLSSQYNETTRTLGGERVTREMVQLAKDLYEIKCL